MGPGVESSSSDTKTMHHINGSGVSGDHAGNTSNNNNINSNDNNNSTDNNVKNGSIEPHVQTGQESGVKGNHKELVQPKFSMPESFHERLNRKNDQIGQLMADVNRLENDLRSRKEEINQLKTLLSTTTQQREEYKTVVISLEIRLKEAERSLNQKEILLQDAIDDAISKENTIQQMKSKLTGLDAKMAAMQSNDDIFMEKERIIRELTQSTNQLKWLLQEKESQLEREIRQNRITGNNNSLDKGQQQQQLGAQSSYYSLTVDPMLDNQSTSKSSKYNINNNGQDWLKNVTKQLERYIADCNMDNMTILMKQYRRTLSGIISNPSSLSSRKLLRIGVVFYLFLIHIILIIYIF